MDQTKKKKKKHEWRTSPAIERCEARTLFTSNKKARAQGTKSQINA
jgi:hypothetical protein